MNTSKNSYVIIYMIVIVVIVSLLLSITSGVLHSRQEENIRLDTKKQILMSLSTFSEEENKIYTDDNAAEMYAQYVKQYVMFDTVTGNLTELDPVADFDVKPAENQISLYVAEIDGAIKYIIPLNGVGLWGAIRAYLALDEDKNTIYGVYFGHASETPGLGANIVLPKFRSQFVGKHLLRDGQFVSVAVMKKGSVDNTREQVDAVSGGTITSKGVESMFLTSLGKYAKWLTADASEFEEVTDSAAAPAGVSIVPLEEGEEIVFE